MQMDNTQEFPLESNSFDLIVMRKGLCQCHAGTCCGGIKANVAEGARFLMEVSRILNKQNPAAAAYLMNAGKGRVQNIEMWKAAAEKAMKEIPGVRIEVLIEYGDFDGFRITPT